MGAQLQKMGILKKKKKMSMLMNLPEEVLMKILMTLPVKSLLLLRCVNKSLNSFLKNPYFIDLHMKQQPDSLLFSYNNRTFLSFYSYESLNEISPHLQIPHISPFPIFCSWPCNGLICVADFTSNIVLCNPATREFKLLPLSPFRRMGWKVVSVGLGFDSNINNYKVVTLLYPFMGHICKIEVYNLSSNSWRQIDHDMPIISGSGVPSNGALHWVALKDNIQFIISFNVSTEVFQNMDLPDDIAPDNPEFNKIPTIINDSLALFTFSSSYSLEPKFMDIWVMKEGSWVKQVSIHGITHDFRPCLLWKNEAILMGMKSFNLQAYTLDTQITTDTGIATGYYFSVRVFVYKESLVSIK